MNKKDILKNTFFHGTAYYPELLTREQIMSDITHMKALGINVIRIGEFAWSKMEPEEGLINLDFFEEIINLFYKNGIYTILGTPTVTPPIWMSFGHSERMNVNLLGVRMNHGARDHFCINNDYYREKSAVISEALAKRFGENEGVLAWQLHNEMGWLSGECICDSCAKKWQDWLKKRYLTVEAFNKAWVNDIWSTTYNSFSDVMPPLTTPQHHSTSMQTMYRIFTYKSKADFISEQAKIVRKYSNAPITTNTNRVMNNDQELLNKELDFSSIDEYSTQKDYAEFVFHIDLFRNIKKDMPFWILETAAGSIGVENYIVSSHSREYPVAEAVASFAGGCGGFCYWHFRQHSGGNEQNVSAIISAFQKPTLYYETVLNVGKAIKEIEKQLKGSKTIKGEVALVYSDRARAFCKTENFGQFDYHSEIRGFHLRCVGQCFNTDIVLEGQNLDGYKLLITPYMQYLDDNMLKKAHKFVENGGIWIVGPLTGIRTGDHTLHTDMALGKLQKIVDVDIRYFNTMKESGSECEFEGLTSLISKHTVLADNDESGAIGFIRGGLADGCSFIFEKNIGKGKIVLLGGMPDGDDGEKILHRILNKYANIAGVERAYTANSDVRVFFREKDNGNRLYVVVNFSQENREITFFKKVKNIITKESISNTEEIEPCGFRIYEEENI